MKLYINTEDVFAVLQVLCNIATMNEPSVIFMDYEPKCNSHFVVCAGYRKGVELSLYLCCVK